MQWLRSEAKSHCFRSGQGHLRVAADAVQMPRERSLHDASRICHQTFAGSDALQQHMLPCLGLYNLMQLASTCRAWHQLIVDIPLHQLSEEARRDVLPSGLTSSLPLLQLLKQQAQLLARLRGKHGFTPDVQRFSFRGDLVNGSQQGSSQQSRCVPQYKFRKILWSPCTCLEEASRWLALELYLDRNRSARAPIVLDTVTGQQVCFQEDPSTMRPASGYASSFHAAWLIDNSDRLMTFMGMGTCLPIACLADVHSHSLLPIDLSAAQNPGSWCPGALQGLRGQFFTVRSDEGAAIDILCWVRTTYLQAGERFEDWISVFNASSGQLLYRISCPEQLHHRFLQLQAEETRPDQQHLSDGSPTGCDVLLAPTQDFLAVVWQYTGVRLPLEHALEQIYRMGLSIHSATTGALQHSKFVTGTACDCQPSWLPHSSNLIVDGNDGLLHVMTSSGCALWSNARASRIPDLSRAPGGHFIDTNLSASPCGRWILVMDAEVPQSHVAWHLRNYTWQLTLLEAPTGQILAQNRSHNGFHRTDVRWSMSGDVCLLANLNLIIICCPHSGPALKTLQQYELLGRAVPSLSAGSSHLSLSPCGSTVLGLDLCEPGLEHWQIPRSSRAVEEAASALVTLQPASLADIIAAPQANSILREAWHPLHSACIYAILSTSGCVHLIDAKANRSVQSWSQDELNGHGTPSGAALRLPLLISTMTILLLMGMAMEIMVVC